MYSDTEIFSIIVMLCTCTYCKYFSFIVDALHCMSWYFSYIHVTMNECNVYLKFYAAIVN